MCLLFGHWLAAVLKHMGEVFRPVRELVWRRDPSPGSGQALKLCPYAWLTCRIHAVRIGRNGEPAPGNWFRYFGSK